MIIIVILIMVIIMIIMKIIIMIMILMINVTGAGHIPHPLSMVSTSRHINADTQSNKGGKKEVIIVPHS